MGNARVSIIVPCYRQAEFLPEALDSVLAQSFSNWECVIVNDGSPDNTDEVARRYLELDNRFKYIKQQNKGLAAARNNGINYSDGEFILPLDADDKISPTYLEKAIEVFAQNADTKLVYCKADTFGLISKPWHLDDYDYDRFIWVNCIFCTAMYKRRDFLKAGGYNINMSHGLEDWDFYLSLLQREDVVHCIDDVLFHYRIKQKSMVTELPGHYEEMLIQVCKNHPDIYDPYKERILLYKRELFEAEKLKRNYESLRSSHAYRLGKLLLKPFSWIRKKSKY